MTTQASGRKHPQKPCVNGVQDGERRLCIGAEVEAEAQPKTEFESSLAELLSDGCHSDSIPLESGYYRAASWQSATLNALFSTATFSNSCIAFLLGHSNDNLCRIRTLLPTQMTTILSGPCTAKLGHAAGETC